MLALSPKMLEVIATEGVSPLKAGFTIRNAAVGSGSCTLASTAAWMSISPASGVVAGQTNAATITCNLSTLAAGTYYGVNKTRCSTASPVLQSLPVQLRVLPRLTLVQDGSNLLLQWTGTLKALENATNIKGAVAKNPRPRLPLPCVADLKPILLPSKPLTRVCPHC